MFQVRPICLDTVARYHRLAAAGITSSSLAAGNRRLDPIIGGGTGDLDPARLHRFRNLALKRDTQQAEIEAGILHLHEVDELEAVFERARRDPAMEKAPIVLLVGPAAADGKLVVLSNDLDVARPKPSYGDRDLVAVSVSLLDVERRITVVGLGPRRAFQQVKQPIETDGRAAIGVLTLTNIVKSGQM